ncbi:hypothetical protein V6N12_043063 [Hibiscus sabdariffa]|uniref:Uncharacterized protein n=1 Tax=Hibiscus sabdariffa TaxID=183260 RepID=A0ABR2DL11_9ROSI
MRVEDLGPTVALKSASHFEEGNENALGGLGSEEGTDYLDTSDVGSYETNSDGDFLFLRTLVRSADPGGTFELMVERPTAVDIPNFKRLYVCFSALKEGFKKYCRPVISLDGCFLKGPFKGEILSIVGRDSNNQIFPIAWAMVEVEIQVAQMESNVHSSVEGSINGSPIAAQSTHQFNQHL